MGDVAPGRPIPPIAFGGDPAAVTARITAGFVDVDDALLARLRGVCADVTVDATTLGEASRDWWPLAMVWALANQVPGLAAAVARPATVEEVAGILRVCDAARVPVTAAAGRSGVCGGSVPVHGGVVLDLCGLRGIVDVDETSLVLDVLAGTFGTPLEDALRRDHAATIGHWPQSMDLSTVGGWPRAVARASTPRATGRSRTWSSGSTSCSPTAASCTRVARPAPRSGPTWTSSSSAARERSGSSPARGSGCTPPRRPSGAPRSASRRSPRDSTPAGASCSAARLRPSCASTTRSRGSGTSRWPTTTCCSCSTRAIR